MKSDMIVALTVYEKENDLYTRRAHSKILFYWNNWMLFISLYLKLLSSFCKFILFLKIKRKRNKYQKEHV